MAMRPFALQAIDHIVLKVHDVARMRAFYCEVLGCTLEREQPELGLTQLRAGASLIDLVSRSGRLGAGGPPGPGHNLEHFCLRVTPFDEARLSAWLGAHGVTARDPGVRYGAQGEGRSLYLEDPEGNRVELKGELPPDAGAVTRYTCGPQVLDGNGP
jgi:glyoxylase I family protein